MSAVDVQFGTFTKKDEPGSEGRYTKNERSKQIYVSFVMNGETVLFKEWEMSDKSSFVSIMNMLLLDFLDDVTRMNFVYTTVEIGDAKPRTYLIQNNLMDASSILREGESICFRFPDKPDVPIIPIYSVEIFYPAGSFRTYYIAEDSEDVRVEKLVNVLRADVATSERRVPAGTYYAKTFKKPVLSLESTMRENDNARQLYIVRSDHFKSLSQADLDRIAVYFYTDDEAVLNP